MQALAFFFGELLILYFLSRRLHKDLSIFLHGISHSRYLTVYLTSIIFLPGTLIHEMAHALAAFLLRMPVVNFEFFPKIEEDRVILGSVSTGGADPMRNFFVGIAPFILGTILILAGIRFFEVTNLQVATWVYAPLFYLLFAISNSMFSSRKDLEGALELVAVVLIIGGLSYLAGLRISNLNLSFLTNSDFLGLFDRGSRLLVVPIGVDVGVIALLKIFRLIFRIS